MSNTIRKEEFDKHVRKRPRMYTGNKGLIDLVKGLIIDFIQSTKSELFLCHFSIEENGKYSLLFEGGANVDDYLSNLDVEKSNYDFRFLATLNALCFNLVIDNTINNELTINFEIESQIFNDRVVDFLDLGETLINIALLNRGTEIIITDKRERYLKQNYFSFPNGIKYLYERIKKEVLGTPQFEIFFDGEFKGNKYQIYIGYRTDWSPQPAILSYANDVYTSCGGSLVDGIIEGLTFGFREYVKSNNLDKYKIKKRKFSNGLILVCSIRGEDFIYGGSFKETLNEDIVKKDTRNLIKGITKDYLKENIDKIDKFIYRFNETELTSGMF